MKRLLLLAVPLLALAAPALATPGNGWSGPVVLNDDGTVPGAFAAMDATATGDAVAVWSDRDGQGYVARRPVDGAWSPASTVPDLGDVSMVAARRDGTALVAVGRAGSGAELVTLQADGSVVPAPLGGSGDTAYAKVDPADDGVVGAVVQPGRLLLGYAAGGDAPGTWRSTTALDVRHLASVTTSAGDTYLVGTDVTPTRLRVTSVDGLTGTATTATEWGSPGPVVWFRIAADPDGRAVLAWVWTGGGREHLTARRITTGADGLVLGPARQLARRPDTGLDPIGQPMVLIGPGGRATVLWTASRSDYGHRVLRAVSGRGDEWGVTRVLDRDVVVDDEQSSQLTADTVPATGATLVTYVDAESLTAVHRSPGAGFTRPQRLFYDYSRGASSPYGVSAVAADGRAWVLKIAVDGLVKVRERPAG